MKSLLAIVVICAWPSALWAQPDSHLERFLEISWNHGPKYPLGIQTPGAGWLDGKFVSVAGFTRHPKDVLKRFPDAFEGQESGFTRLAFAIDGGTGATDWRRIDDFPLSGRQSLAAAVVQDELYLIGGFNYSPPHAYRDVCRLHLRDGKAEWESLSCQFPWPVCEALATTIGTKIYAICGADYHHAPGTPNIDFHTETGRTGGAVGRALFVLDTEKLSAGWKRLADLPGTPRAFPCGGAADGKIYVFSGLYAPSERNAYYNVIDNWMYDPAADRWSRQPDMPDAACNGRSVVYKDRYVLLVGGYKYGKTWLFEGRETEAHGPQPVTTFLKSILVFDTQTMRFGTATPLLEQTASPAVAIRGETLYSLGGEGGELWHPDAYQIGVIREAQ